MPRLPAPVGGGPASSDKSRKKPGLFSRLAGRVRQKGVDMVSSAVDRFLDPSQGQEDREWTVEDATEGEAPPPAQPARTNILHNVAEKMRGAADSYLAVKLDEIEARVDEKLDSIEGRLDRKVLEIHKQLIKMRDHEIRHRLRLLKMTLAFTLLVGLLSLGYKWLSGWLANH
jgi:hypothetical protein